MCVVVVVVLVLMLVLMEVVDVHSTMIGLHA